MNSRISESWFSKKPKIDLKKMNQYATELLTKFKSVFSSDKGTYCEKVVKKALNSSAPDQVLSKFIAANVNSKMKKTDDNYLSSWLETAKFAYDVAVKNNKSKAYCVLIYMYAILSCAFQIPARLFYPFANPEKSNIQKKDIWLKTIPETSFATLLFWFVVTLYALCVSPSIIAHVLSGDMLTIFLLVCFNVLVHYADEIASEKKESYSPRLTLEWLR